MGAWLKNAAGTLHTHNSLPLRTALSGTASASTRALLTGMLLLGLSACVAETTGPTDDGQPERALAGSEPRVVVSIVDSAINPYHAYFYAGSEIYADMPPSSITPAVLAELGVDPQDSVRLTRSGDIEADKAADTAFWDQVEHGRPYWFEGSNIVAISFCEEGFRPLEPDVEKSAHGTGVSAALLKANPEAILLFVESCAQPEAHEMLYALEHPAVDIFSFSYNLGLPITEVGAYRAVVELGKLIFQAAGNYLVPVEYQGGPGSWWTIGVSGIDVEENGQSSTGALLPDFVAGFRDSLPFCNDCETGLVPIGGTSVSTPQAAGLASKALLEARRWYGHSGGIRPAEDGELAAMVMDGDRRIRNWDLRRALEEAAYVEYGPEDYAGPSLVVDLPPIGSLPYNPLAPWLQLAWGDLSTDPGKGVLQEALAHLGLWAATRAKSEDYCLYMAEQMRRRQAYGDLRGQVTGEVVPEPNPYRFCDAD